MTITASKVHDEQLQETQSGTFWNWNTRCRREMILHVAHQIGVTDEYAIDATARRLCGFHTTYDDIACPLRRFSSEL